MNSIVRNTLAILVGIALGSIVNLAIISISGSIIPPPKGADLTTTEGLKASMHLFQPINFLMPFLAHSIGTFVGALATALIAASGKTILALVIGFFFLIGGIASVLMLPSPLWFTIIDLVFAYIPIAWIASVIVKRNPIKH